MLCPNYFVLLSVHTGHRHTGYDDHGLFVCLHAGQLIYCADEDIYTCVHSASTSPSHSRVASALPRRCSALPPLRVMSGMYVVVFVFHTGCQSQNLTPQNGCLLVVVFVFVSLDAA